jgi:hypothetical protein
MKFKSIPEDLLFKIFIEFQEKPLLIYLFKKLYNSFLNSSLYRIKNKLKNTIAEEIKNEKFSKNIIHHFTFSELRVLKKLLVDYKTKKNVIIALIGISFVNYNDLPENFRKEKKVCLEFLKKSGKFIENFSKDIYLNDRKMCLVACKTYGEAVKFFSKEMLEDYEICLCSVKNNGAGKNFFYFYFKKKKKIKKNLKKKIKKN